VLSVIVAIVFTPALCATLLKPIPKGHHGTKRGFFGWFNRAFDRSSHGYANTVARGLGRTKRLMVVYLAIVIAMGWMFTRIPTA
ncbi:efflux RND transporter permease subunit, partial [Cupriavidus sp. SIMBA_020]